MSPRTSTHQASKLKYIDTIFFCLLRLFKMLLDRAKIYLSNAFEEELICLTCIFLVLDS